MSNIIDYGLKITTEAIFLFLQGGKTIGDEMTFRQTSCSLNENVWRNALIFNQTAEFYNQVYM